MTAMFGECESITSLDISGFQTTNLTSCASMFSSCKKLTSLDLSNFDMSKVSGSDYSYMYSDCWSLKQVRLGTKVKLGVSSTLPDHSDPRSLVSGADGMWYPAGSTTGYTPKDLTQKHNNKKQDITYYAVKSEASAASGTGYSLRSPAAAPDPDAGLSGGQNLTDPVTPVTPIDPAAPVDPVNPVTPVAPTDPAAPVDPVNPVTPGEETGTEASQGNPTTTE